MLFTISKSHCAEEQPLSRQDLIQRYQVLIQHAQRSPQTLSKDRAMADILGEYFKQVIEQAKSELERLGSKQILSKEELIKSHQLLQDLWS